MATPTFIKLTSTDSRTKFKMVNMNLVQEILDASICNHPESEGARLIFPDDYEDVMETPEEIFELLKVK